MLDLLHWLFEVQTTGRVNTPRRVPRQQTWNALERRGLTEYVSDAGARVRTVLTTAGLTTLSTFGGDEAVRTSAFKRLVIEAGHCLALADETDGIRQQELRAEAADILAWVPEPIRVTLFQGEKPRRMEHAGAHWFRKGPDNNPQRCAYPDCDGTQSSPNHVIEADLCGYLANPGHGPGEKDVRCTRPRHLGRALPGDHSWCPADLAPSDTTTQRAAYAADQLHAARTANRKAHAQRRVDDAALCGAKRRYPDPRPRLGIGGLGPLTDCEDCAQIIEADQEHARKVHEPRRLECGVHYESSATIRCTLSPGHVGRNHSWCPEDLAPSDTTTQRAAYAADQERAEKVGELEHERSLVEVRAELGNSAPHIADSTHADPYEEYGADRRWTYVGPGGSFQLTGEDGGLAVYAVAVHGMHGRFTLMMLNRVVTEVALAPDGYWRLTDGS